MNQNSTVEKSSVVQQEEYFSVCANFALTATAVPKLINDLLTRVPINFINRREP
jgi:hypothetical protein